MHRPALQRGFNGAAINPVSEISIHQLLREMRAEVFNVSRQNTEKCMCSACARQRDILMNAHVCVCFYVWDCVRINAAASL